MSEVLPLRGGPQATPQRRASDPEVSAWVHASAGTGKTKVLTDRVLRLLLAGSEPQHLLCLTYTKAAAAEMANRIARALGEWVALDDTALGTALRELTGTPPDDDTLRRARRLFARVLEAPGGLRIETIHAFCQSLLQRFPLEAGVAPHFTVLDDVDANGLRAEAREAVLARVGAGEDAALGAALREVAPRVQQDTFAGLVGDLTGARRRLETLLRHCGTIEGFAALLHRVLDIGQGDDEAALCAAACADAAFDVAGLRAAAQAMLQGAKSDRKTGAVIADWLAKPDSRVAGFDSYRAAFLRKDGTPRTRLIHKEALELAPNAAAVLGREAERLETVRARMQAPGVARATRALVTLGHAVDAAFGQHKGRLGRLDYDDLIARARALLGGAVAWVLFKLDGGLDHILIDEAQDSNADQWALISALAEEFFAGEGARSGRDRPRTVFAVGDPKQSIFSFQGAEPDTFARMAADFARRVPEAGQHWDAVSLDTSFRSVPAVLEVVDCVFAEGPARNGVVEPGAQMTHRANREGQGGLVELWAPLQPRDVDEPDPWEPPVEQMAGDSARSRLARLIAKRIARMLGDRERLESRNRPIRAGDVMVLVRRRSAFVEDLVRELKRRDVGVAGVDRMVLAEQIAVRDLIALGRVLLLPEDDLTLATVLKGPLFGFDDDDLFALAHDRGETSLWTALRRHDEARYAAAAARLERWLGLADLMPPYELYCDVLGPEVHDADGPDPASRTGRWRLLDRLGWDAKDPIDEFLAQALAYDMSHTPSLEGFLHWIDAGGLVVKRELDQPSEDAVRVMTVHGAKGLQAPIVFLPDTMGSLPNRGGVVWHDAGDSGLVPLWAPKREAEDPVAAAARQARQQAEAREHHRLLYVAMTRAEDRLYVCGWTGKKGPPEDCWYGLVQTGMVALGDPVDDHFLATAEEADAASIWRHASPQTAPPQPEQAPPAAQVPDGGLPDWTRSRPSPELRPPRPLAPSRPEGEEPPVFSPLSAAERDRRFQRGLLVHKLLQVLPDMPAARRRDAALRFLAGRGLTQENAAEIAAETLAVLDDPAFSALFGPGSRAEVAVVGRVGAAVISGQIDRLLVAADRVLIADYKTNRPAPESLAAVPPVYLRQMAAYRALLQQIYADRPVDCALLWTDGPRLLALPGGLLDGHAPGAETPSGA